MKNKLQNYIFNNGIKIEDLSKCLNLSYLTTRKRTQNLDSWKVEDLQNIIGSGLIPAYDVYDIFFDIKLPKK